MFLLAPFRFVFSFSVEDSGFEGSAVFSFLHPFVFSGRFDIGSGQFKMKILDRSIGKNNIPSYHDSGGRPDDAVDKSDEDEELSLADGSAFTENVSFDRRENGEIVSGTFQKKEESVMPQVSPRFSPASDRSNESEKKSDESIPHEKEEKQKWYERLQRNRWLFFIRNGSWRRKFIRWIGRVLRSLLQVVRLDGLRLSVRAGTEEPFITGILAGIYNAALHGLSLKEPYSVSFEPVFMTNCFACSGAVIMRTSLARLLMPVVVAISTFPMFHTIRLAWRYHRLNKKDNRRANI